MTIAKTYLTPQWYDSPSVLAGHQFAPAEAELPHWMYLSYAKAKPERALRDSGFWSSCMTSASQGSLAAH